jgi:hypothetical protein
MPKLTDRQFDAILYLFESTAHAEAIFEIGVDQSVNPKKKCVLAEARSV